MSKACQFVDGCPMFAYFTRTAETVYKRLYCEGSYERCARRTRRLEGEEVPANLLPHGAKLWPDGAVPPPTYQFPKK